RAGPAGILPFRLRRQPVGPRALLTLRQPLAERHRLVPAHVDHRVVVRLRESRVLPGVAPVLDELALGLVPAIAALAVPLGLRAMSLLVDEPAELADRDLVDPQIEG